MACRDYFYSVEDTAANMKVYSKMFLVLLFSGAAVSPVIKISKSIPKVAHIQNSTCKGQMKG